MELHPISKLHALSFLDTQGSSIPSLKEWIAAWIELHWCAARMGRGTFSTTGE